MFEEYFSALQKAPFRLAKWPILDAKIGHIALWNGLYRTAKWAISEHGTDFFGLRYGVYQKAVRTGTGHLMPRLTFIHISFAKIFCQNLVKKNCKHVFKFFTEDSGIRMEKKRGKHLSEGPEACLIHRFTTLTTRGIGCHHITSDRYSQLRENSRKTALGSSGKGRACLCGICKAYRTGCQ